MANIYVIDDDRGLLRMMELMLKRGGHEATMFHDPREGLAKIKAARPDVLLLDVMMPGVSGHEICREIRATKEISDLPVLILTARAQEVDRLAALDSGADEYLSKPVTSQDLLSKIDDLLKLKKSSRGQSKQGVTISVMGMRGGVGRTTIAVNLAAALRRISQEDVALIDMSPSGGHISLNLRLAPTQTWLNLPDINNLDWPRLQAALTMHSSGLMVLAAPAVPSSPNSVSGALMTAAQSLNLFKENMLFTVIDLPNLISPEFEAVIKASDMVLHVVNPELISLQMAGLTMRALSNANIEAKQMGYILNQVTPEATIPATAIERALKTRPAFQIAYDSNQTQALGQGMPISLTSAQSPLPATIGRIAQGIWQRAKK